MAIARAIIIPLNLTIIVALLATTFRKQFQFPSTIIIAIVYISQRQAQLWQDRTDLWQGRTWAGALSMQVWHRTTITAAATIIEEKVRIIENW